MLPMKKWKDRRAAETNFFQGPAQTKVLPHGSEPLLESGDSVCCATLLAVDFRGVQIQLGVIRAHADGFAAQDFGAIKTFLRQRGEKPGIGKIKRIAGRETQRPPRVS